MEKFLKYFRLVKVDEAQRIVYGLVTAEREDKDQEICDYATTKPEYQKVNDEMGKASNGENIMPLREMHQLHAVGAGKSIDFDDAKKEIHMAFKVVEDSTWKKVLEKVLIGFSQGGRYIKRWVENGKNYYTAGPGEVSLVDNPALSGAVIEYVKADGAIEKVTVKVVSPDVSEFSTRLEKLSALVGDLVSQHSAAEDTAMKPEQIAKCAAALGIAVEEFTKTFIESETSPLVKKTMAALHAHIKKAIDHHQDHHEQMVKAHAAHTAHLEKCMKAAAAVMGDEKEAEKVLKTLTDELAAMAGPELILIGKTADGVEVFRKKGSAEVKLEGLKTAEGDMTKAIADAVKAATEPLTKKIEELEKGLAPNNGGTGVRLALIGRDGKEIKKASEASAADPLPV